MKKRKIFYPIYIIINLLLNKYILIFLLIDLDIVFNYFNYITL